MKINFAYKGTVLLVLLLAALCLVPVFTVNKYFLHIFIIIFISIIWSSTYRFIIRTGQIHFGHVAFIGLGAYSSAALAITVHLPIWLCILLGGVTGLVFAIMLGYPALRVKALYFSIITWGSGEVLRYMYMRLKVPFGGTYGLINIPQPGNFTIPFLNLTIDWSTKVPYYFLALALMLLTLVILYRLEFSRYGLIFNAIREGDIVAQSVGINIMRYKVLVFAICAFLASVGGAFYGHYATSIAPADVTVVVTIMLGCYVLVGGQYKFAGPIIGTILMIVASELFSGYAFFKVMLYSALIVFVMLLLPEGLIGLPKVVSLMVERLRKLLARGEDSRA